MLAQQTNVNYLGQNPPGQVATLFAPGILSTASYEHSSPAFSPDGSVVLWTVVDRNYRASMFEMKYENGKWSSPYRPTFADSTADDYYPSFSIDGKKLYFSSRRKVPEGYTEASDIRIWEVDRNPWGWGRPVPFDTAISRGGDYAHSVTSNGTLYYTSLLGGGTNFNIRTSRKSKDGYAKPVVLPYSINSVDYEDGAYISPDETFLIFESIRPEGVDGSIDLYIAFKNKSGQWSLPINMGPKVNSPGSERFARLSPDGKFLFFGSTRNPAPGSWGFDIYWIDAKVIDELRNGQVAKNLIKASLGNQVIDALYKNDVDRSGALLKEWVASYPNSLDATILYSSALRKLGRSAEAEQLLATNAHQWKDNIGFSMETALVKLGLGKNDEADILLTPILANADQRRERFKYLSNALLDMKRFKESDEYFEKAMAINANRFEFQRRARRYALIGEKDRAFQSLNQAVRLGATSRKEFETDADLVALRDDERWKAFLDLLK
ncbi:MAG: PD40 domain-containing protein [Chitinophagaceae bacterium]|nr:PD40 domain-containing protein [Chitinophagaceae bacterium]